MSMEKGQNTEWALNAKANVSLWIAIEAPAKGYKTSSSMHNTLFIYRTLSTLSTWQYQELDFRKASICSCVVLKEANKNISLRKVLGDE